MDYHRDRRGVDLVLVLPIIERKACQRMTAIIAASGIGISTRSLINEALAEVPE